MEPEGLKFGGPTELSGAVDLISQYKLLLHHEYFCKRSLPVSLSDAHYLLNVVGDAEIRKGEGMQLDQLIQNASQSRDTNARIQPFDLDELQEAFQLHDTTPVELPPGEKGVPTIASKSKSESKDEEKKRKKHKERDKDKDREHKKHKHKHKDKDKEKDRDRKKVREFRMLQMEFLPRKNSYLIHRWFYCYFIWIWIGFLVLLAVKVSVTNISEKKT